MKKIIFLFISSFFFLSCDKSIKSEQGGIDIISNVYFNASKGLDDHKQFHISKLNYINDEIIELVPNIEDPEEVQNVIYLKDTTFYKSHTLDESKSMIFKEEEATETAKSVYKKKTGAIWVKVPIFDFEKRKDISDTILYNNKKKYKRFEIRTADNYSVYYVFQTDTILPYSLNPIADKEYKGRLERIDSYDKEKDLFSTIWLVPRKKLDQEALNIFKFNNDLRAKVKDANSN